MLKDTTADLVLTCRACRKAIATVGRHLYNHTREKTPSCKKTVGESLHEVRRNLLAPCILETVCDIDDFHAAICGLLKRLGLHLKLVQAKMRSIPVLESDPATLPGSIHRRQKDSVGL